MLRDYLQKKNENYEISYMTIRKAIGFLGIGLPIVLWIGMKIRGCGFMPDSISNYYFTRMGTVMTGTLCVVAMFLFAYRGKEKIDTIVSNLASVFALGIALFPNQVDFCEPNCYVVLVTSTSLVMNLHFISAGLFLLTLAGMSLFLFTRTNQIEIKKPKRNRNRVFRICGWTIVVCVAILGAYFAYTSLIKPGFEIKQFIFSFESIALVAFGIAWLTKAEIFFPDPPEDVKVDDGSKSMIN